MRGKFIVLYGINNLGKTTQAKLLVEELGQGGHPAKYLKYPIYDLEPSGVILNNYLRGGNTYKLSPREAQIIYAMNRAQYEQALLTDLEAGINIVAEDYWGTGVAWGMGAGVEKKFLLELNTKFLREDLALVFVGERFLSGLEHNHRHEQDSDLTERVEAAHQELADEFGWQEINANQSKDQVFEEVWSKVQAIL